MIPAVLPIAFFPLFLPTGFLLLFLGFLVFIIVALVLNFVREKKRREELREFAARQRWDFIERDSKDRPRRYKQYGPFGKGHSRYAFNIMAGTKDDAGFEVFDYHYAETTHTGKSSSTQHYHFTVCALEMPISAPGLSIQREHVGHKMLGAVGAGDIDFESDEFSRRYWVKCDDRRFAYDVVHARMMEFLLKNQGWHWEWQGNTLLVHKKGKMRPAKAKKMLTLTHRFRELLPRHRLVPHPLPE